MKRNLVTWAFLILTIPVFAQQKAGITGFITDKLSGKGIPGIHIRISSEDVIGENEWVPFTAISSVDGAYSIAGLDSGICYLHASGIGYDRMVRELNLRLGEEQKLDIHMEELLIPLGEVSVTALRTDHALKDVSLPLSTITQSQIELQTWNTAPDLLASQPGVNLVRDGMWATSVNIRGLSEQRLVTLVDGNRIETATDIAGAMAMIDVSDIERVEIVKGAASAIYGTGAMGGIINIHTRGGQYSSEPYLKGRSSAGWSSVNNLRSGMLSLNAGAGRWYLKASGTYRKAGNVQTPQGELLNSQFNDNNISALLAIRPSTNKEFKIDYQKFHAWDVGLPGARAYFPATATASYSRADRNLVSASYTGWNLLPSLTKLEARYFIQSIVRKVDLRPSASVQIEPLGDHLTNGLQLHSEWEPAYNHQLIAGVDVWQRFLTTSREKTIHIKVNDSTTNVKVIGEVPIPASSFTNFGFYLQDEWTLLPEKLKLLLGARGDYITVRNDSVIDPAYVIMNGVRNDAPAGQRITFQEGLRQDMSWSANAGALYTVFKGLDLSLSVARGYRAPSLEERFKYIDLGSFVRLGNPELKPEQGWFTDFGIRLWNPHFNLVADAYLNSMENLVVEDSGLFIYSYTANPDQRDTLLALVNSNVDRARLYGTDFTFSWICLNNLVFTGSLGFVKGINRITNKALPQIPPLSGSLGLRYTLPGWSTFYATARYADRQNQVAGLESSTPGYAVYDAGFHTQPIGLKKVKLEFTGGIENIFNRAYQLHLSTTRGVIRDEPGRNFYIRMNLLF